MAESTGIKGPKHRMLTEEETFSTFTAWQSRLKAILRKDTQYTRFLVDNGQDTAWKKSVKEFTVEV